MTESILKDSAAVGWSIKWKLMAIITVLVVCLVAILSYVQISSQKEMLEHELNNRIKLMKANLIERGKSFIINLSHQVENNIASYNFSGVMEIVNESVKSSRELKYAILMNSSGMAFVHTLKPDLVQNELTGKRDQKALSHRSMVVMTYDEADGSVIEIIMPLQISTEPWGVLRLVYTLKLLNDEIESSRGQIRQEIKKMIYRSVMISFVLLGGCLIIVFILSTGISRPIIHLTESAKRLARGDFSVSSDIKIGTRDEVGVLGETFVEMSNNLRNSYSQLEEFSKRYRALFEYSPISLWEEDLSQVKKYVDGLRDQGVTDFRKYFIDHPEEVQRCAEMIKILDVNESTLKLYQVDTKENFTSSLSQILAEQSHEILIKEFIAVADGQTFEIECVNRTLAGKEITVLIKSTIPPGYEETWSKVYISVHDLTERSRAEFLENIFGRYMSEEVMHTIIENPEAIKLGGEKRNVGIMMSDLRGFTAISERLEPEKVVQMLNTYFEVMVEVIQKYSGTINEIIGDALLVIFGAPQEMPDRAQRAIACAIEMQNAMAEVNRQNRVHGLPELEMGIGINECEVIVGNVGSKKRSKYGVVGSGVNMTGRIESYTVGGQILISESAKKEAGEILRIDHLMEIHPKGAEKSLTLYEAGGIGGQYNTFLEDRADNLFALAQGIPVRFNLLEGKQAGAKEFSGMIFRLSRTSGEMRLETVPERLSNLKLNLTGVSDELSRRDFYGKVVSTSDTDRNISMVRFTALPSAVDGYFQAAIEHGGQFHKNN